MVKIEELSEEQIAELPEDIREAVTSGKEEIIKARSVIWNLNKEVKNSSSEEAINMAKLLVEENPANVERISDEKIRNKILQEKYWVDNLEELKVMFPDYAKKDDWEDEDLSELEQLKQQVKLMQHNNKKTKTKEAIENIAEKNQDIIKQIPDFEEKLTEELKYISDNIDPNERVKKAFSLLSGQVPNSATLYWVLQGMSWVKSDNKKDYETQLKKEQNEYRKLLWLKQK